jgi:sugar phosphate isomerase/epimerase
MALEGPSLRFARMDETMSEAAGDAAVARALRLAREVEELLSRPSLAVAADPVSTRAAHSSRIARAMAASLVDELEALARSARVSASFPAAHKTAKNGSA